MENWTFVDKHANKIKCENNVVKLALEFENKFRDIGFYNKLGSFIKGSPNPLDKVKHKFHKANGYGVNYHAVEHLETDDNRVVFITQEGIFSITKREIKQSNAIKQFSKAGFELQYIIPLSLMTRVK